MVEQYAELAKSTAKIKEPNDGGFVEEWKRFSDY